MELVRHRVFSFAQESTRYCNYSKDKFDNEITFILPDWWKSPIERVDTRHYLFDIEGAKEEEASFLDTLSMCENTYINMVESGIFTPQQARQVLPNALKTEIVMTGFTSDWRKVFDQRVDGITGNPHPDMKALMEPVKEEFIKRNII